MKFSGTHLFHTSRSLCDSRSSTKGLLYIEKIQRRWTFIWLSSIYNVEFAPFFNFWVYVPACFSFSLLLFYFCHFLIVFCLTVPRIRAVFITTEARVVHHIYRYKKVFISIFYTVLCDKKWQDSTWAFLHTWHVLCSQHQKENWTRYITFNHFNLRIQIDVWIWLSSKFKLPRIT